MHRFVSRSREANPCDIEEFGLSTKFTLAIFIKSKGIKDLPSHYRTNEDKTLT